MRIPNRWDAQETYDCRHALSSGGAAVSLLCSPEANCITGQILNVDGGAALIDAHLPLEVQEILARPASPTCNI